MAVNIYELDFTGIESTNLIPEGTHSVKISNAEFKKASTGSDQLEIAFEKSDGSIRRAWYNLQPQALWKLKGVLEALGIPADGKIKLNTKTLIGKTCQIIVEGDPNDSTRFIVSRVFKLENNSSNTVAEAPVNSIPAAAPVQQAIPQAQTPPWMQPQQTQPVAPQPQPQAPVQPTAAPVQQQLPPWMQPQQQAPASAVNQQLPPWINKQN